MSALGQRARLTQKCVVASFQGVLGYAFLGNWNRREGNNRDDTRALKQAMMQELLTGRTRLVPRGETAHAKVKA